MKERTNDGKGGIIKNIPKWTKDKKWKQRKEGKIKWDSFTVTTEKLINGLFSTSLVWKLSFFTRNNKTKYKYSILGVFVM